MPAGSKTNVPRTYGKKTKKKPTVKKLARRVAVLEGETELKWTDLQVPTLWSTTPLSVSMFGVPEGEHPYERIGSEISAKYIDIGISAEAAAGNPNFSFRLSIVLDKQTNGATTFTEYTGPSPTTAQQVNAVFDNTNITSQLMAPINDRTKERYRIIYDKVIVHNKYSSTVIDRYTMKKRIPLHNMKIIFADTTNAAAAIVSKDLYVIITMGTASALPTTALITGRLWFTDT